MRKLAALVLLGALHAQEPAEEAAAPDELAALRDRIAQRIEQVATDVEIGEVGAVGEAPEEDPAPVRQELEASPVPVGVPGLDAPGQFQYVVPPVAVERIMQGDLQTFALVRQELANAAVAGAITEELGAAIDATLEQMATNAQAIRRMNRPLARKLKIDTSANLIRLQYAAERSVAATTKQPQASAALSDEALGAHRASGRKDKWVPPAMDAPALDAPRVQRVRIKPSAPGAALKPKGVKIQIDGAMLAKVLHAQGFHAGIRELLQVEDAVVAAQSGAEAFRRLHAYTESKKAEFVRRFCASRDLGRPRLVSLADLVERAGRYRRRWDQRPDELRTVGGLTRIHGYLREEATGDLVLVGRAEPGEPAILLDDLTVGLRTVWREGRTPTVSLEPDPKNLGGLHHARIDGVPHDSAFALTMLEADYRMKRVMIGAPGHEIPGYTSLPDLSDDLSERFARYWLFPVQPTARSILLGPGGSSALFDAGVQVLTEDAVRTESGLEFSGRSHPVHATVARSFTEHYDAIAQRHEEFRRLRGLFDIVLLANVLRLTAPEDATVASLCALPYEPVRVPKGYPAVIVERPSGNRVVYYVGGCEVNARTRWRSLIEGGSAGLAAGESLRVLDAADGQGESERHFVLGMRLYLEMKLDEADDAFTRAIDAEPSFAEAYAKRASVRLTAGRRRAALWDAAQAVSLAPTDVGLQAVFYRLLVQTGAPDPLRGASPAARRAVALSFRRAAWFLSTFARYADAERALDEALRADPEDEASWTLRAEVRRESGNLSGALSDANRALKLAPKDMRALFQRAAVHQNREEYRQALGDLTRALDLNRSDLTLRMACLETRSRIRLGKRDFDGAGEDATFAIEIVPKYWRPHATRGLALMGLVLQMPKQTNDPKIKKRFAMCCAQALANLETALRLGPANDPEFQDMAKQLRPIRDELLKMAER